MARVNPPPNLRTPKRFMAENDSRSYFEQLEFILFQLWGRTGGQNDDINDGGESIEAILIRLDIIELRLDVIEAAILIINDRLDYLEGSTTVTAIDHTIDNTITGHQTIICTADITVFLDATPNDRDTAEIKQTDTKLTIDGNGKLIDGNATLSIRKQNTALKTGLTMRYSSSLDGWYVL